MIFQADWPLEAGSSGLRALYVALNSPVVRQDPLPVGPASAAVALHVGVPGVSVAIRSVRTGQVAFFTSAIDSPPPPTLALEAALSFSEALGFVFDNDEVGSDGAGADAAARLWCELIGEEYRQQRRAPERELPEGSRALALHRPDPPIDDNPIPGVLSSSASADSPDPSTILSKFRWPSGPIAARKTA